MFSKSLCLVLLGISMSSTLAAPTIRANEASCDASAVVSTKTVTVTASSVATNVAIASTGDNTSSSGSGSGSSAKKSGSKSGSSSSSSSSSADAADSASTSTTASSAAASTDSAATGSNNNASSGSNNNAATGSATGSLSTTDITTNATADSTDPQSSLTLDPRVIATGFLNNGQDVQEAGQVASITSNNNFINYCLTQTGMPITNGQQITTGSCNPAPIGTIPSVDNMPSAKFEFPTNMGSVTSNTEFTIKLNMNNLDTGNFVNANENYFAAPQQLNSNGLIIGHTHVVIEAINGLDDTTPTDPQKFAFFKGINTAAVDGQVTADVTSGVPDGTYRVCTINSSSNHQPVIAPIAQHGSLDDCVYFTASATGAASTTDTATAAASATDAASTTDTAAADASATASKSGKNKKN
ncbi:hypothetical protein J3R30DRAFT_3464617 [Lentinula aciculospora]|uniref:Ribosomal protein s17 n=1 Tax=Lentinula aciculospora TaxID=153920 RepID=A0A9W9DQH2_9AGAR|nr:hypothetical protein J3R30DRAFT_3464617 [Lentinula aciculospora]